MLDSKSLKDLVDVIRDPPVVGKYDYLKGQILNHFRDSADRQLHRTLTELEFEDRKPSQLLRYILTLAVRKALENVLRIKWLNLIPVSVQYLLKIFKASNLDDLGIAADKIIEFEPSVIVASNLPTRVFSSRTKDSLAADFPFLSSIADELAVLRTSVEQLVAGQQFAGAPFREWRRPRARPEAFMATLSLTGISYSTERLLLPPALESCCAKVFDTVPFGSDFINRVQGE